MTKEHGGDIEKARGFRRRATYPERLVWGLLRDRKTENAKFRRQFPLGPYVLDFYCEEVPLCVEIDGETHDARVVHDIRRTAYLNSQGIEVLRVANADVIQDLEAVQRYIAAAVRRRRDEMPRRRLKEGS
jgi:very-short-patch-repair endonuclease